MGLVPGRAKLRAKGQDQHHASRRGLCDYAAQILEGGGVRPVEILRHEHQLLLLRQAEVDLDPSDFSDLMETGFGLGGYATDGTWIIQGSFGMLKLGAEPSGSIPAGVGGGTFAADYFFEMTVGQLTVGNTVYRSKNFKFSFTPYAGVRYLKHEIGSDIVATQGATTITIVGGVDQNWTDFLIGSSIGYVLSPKWTWKLAAHDFVGPRLGDLQPAQLVRQVVAVRPGIEIRRRALQHGDVCAVVRHGRHHGGRRGPGTDHHDGLAPVVQVFGPGLRMHDVPAEALHAGEVRRIAFRVPVITLEGDSHRSRVGVSLLNQVGLEHLIAKTPDEYVSIACSLATDIEALTELRTGLRSRMKKSPLMDEVGFTKGLESAYRKM